MGFRPQYLRGIQRRAMLNRIHLAEKDVLLNTATLNDLADNTGLTIEEIRGMIDTECGEGNLRARVNGGTVELTINPDWY